MTILIADAFAIFAADPAGGVDALEHRLEQIGYGNPERGIPGTLTPGMRLRTQPPRRGTAGKLAAYVSDNRWVADCGICGSGIAVADVKPPFGQCLTCGTRWPIQFPRERERIEAALARRDPRNRHYHPHLGEKPETLELENDALLPGPPRRARSRRRR